MVTLSSLPVAPLVGAAKDGDTSYSNSMQRRVDADDLAPYPGCKQHDDIEFILVEGNANLIAVEDNIRKMLGRVGINVVTRNLTKEEFNAAEQSGDFHLSFSETWGSPYDPHTYASGWMAKDEGHDQALSGLGEDKDRLYEDIRNVLQEEDHLQRTIQWESILNQVHKSAVMLPLWGKRIPTVLNKKRLSGYEAGNQQFDYPVHRLQVLNGPTTVTIAPGGQTGRFSSVGRLDPHTYRPNEFFSNNWVYEGLVQYGSFGQVLPALAESWTIDDSGQKYTFQLRDNVQFHDGTAWDCAAAKLNFDHVLAEPLRSSSFHGWYGLIEQIDSWRCDSDMELVIETKNKYYPFLQELAFIRPIRMLSPASFAGDADPLTSNSCHVGWGIVESETGGPNVTCAGITNISGTGPFMFSSRSSVNIEGEEVDDQVIFTRNTNYWDGTPSIETLIIQRYETSKEVKNALLNGTLDVVWGSGVLDAQDLVELEQDFNSDLSVFHTGILQHVIMLLNSGKPPLDDIEIRKTIIHAIDKKTLVDNELGVSGVSFLKPVDGVFPKDAPYCDVDLTPRWDYDPEKAQFLNCPSVTSQSVSDNDSLALALGLGFGIACFVLIMIAGTYYNRSKKYKEELDQLQLQKEAVSA